MRAAMLLLFVAGPVFAQYQYRDTWYPHHNFFVAGGIARPRGELSPAFSDTGALSIGYGYRFYRYLQADVGLDIAFGAAGIRQFLNTGVGIQRIHDRQYMLPFGGRAVFPLGAERVLLSAGGGGAYLRYAEAITQPSDFFRIACPVCTARDGWAYYGVAELSTYLDRGRHFRVGVNGRVFRGHTEGEPLGDVSGRTKDRWVILEGIFGFSF